MYLIYVLTCNKFDPCLVNIFSEAKETHDFLEEYKTSDDNEENLRTLEEIEAMKDMESFYIFGTEKCSQLTDNYNPQNSCMENPTIVVYRTNGRNLKGLLQNLQREYGH